jgi:hypothetical protein
VAGAYPGGADAGRGAGGAVRAQESEMTENTSMNKYQTGKEVEP